MQEKNVFVSCMYYFTAAMHIESFCGKTNACTINYALVCIGSGFVLPLDV